MYQKFIDTIKKFIKYMTGTQEEKNLIKLKDNLEKTFKEKYKNTDFSKIEESTAKEGNVKYSLTSHPEIYNEIKKYDSMEDFIFESNISYDELEAAGLGGMGEIVEYYNNKNKPILKDYDNTKESATFTEDRLDSIISESISDYDDNYARAYITHMSPEQFLGLTASEETMQRLNQETGELDVEKLAKERQHIFLDVNLETGKVTGHEGRHRMLALQKAGINDVEMVIYPDSGTYDRENAPRIESMNLIGQDFRIGKGTDTTIGEMIPVSKANVEELRNNLKTDSKVRYSLTDSQGRELSKEQQEFFKDSKVRDENGNLKVMYRGGEQDINIFDKNQKATRYTNFGATYKADVKGFFFTDNIEYAKEFGNPKEYYLNSTKPLTYKSNIEDLNRIFKPMLDEMLENQDIYQWQYDRAIQEGTIYRRFIDENGISWEDVDKNSFNKSLEIMKELGYDSTVVNEDEGGTSTFVFESNQIKNVDNLNPTSNPDIRYSLTVSEANTGVDNQGRKLTKEQQEYFKDSKVTDEKGNLIPVFHTTTGLDLVMNKAEFYEFNPVGTPGYRYGDKVVNFYTDSKEMSGSYVDQNYIEADTTKIENLDQAQGIVDYYNSSGIIDWEIQENNGTYELYDNEYGEVIHTFDSQDDLFRNIRKVVIDESGLDADINANGYQYEGYLNIKNPYIIDAKGKEWNRIEVGNLQELKQGIKEKWDIPERQLDKLEGNTLKELNRDLTKIGYQLKNDEYGDLSLYTKEGILAADLLNVNDVMQEIRIDLDSDLNTPISTNDIVFQALAENDAGANYDGVIIENVVDYGGVSTNEETPHNVYVDFNSNQFKSYDNLKPTTDQDIRYSLTTMEDSEMDEISQQQFDYFKNTKAVNKYGELETVYHGTPAEFNVFDIEKAGKTGLVFGNGFYFTNSRGTARGFTEGGLYGDTDDQIKTGYVNIEKPASRDTKTMSYNEFKQLYEALNNNPKMYMDDMEMSSIDALLSDYGDIYNDKEGTIKTFFDSYNTDVDMIDNLSYMYNPTEFYKTLRDVTGYDGIIVENPSGYDAYEKYFIAFNPDQFKLKDNKTPTNNVDMRLSLTRADQITPMDVAPYSNTWGKQVEDAIAPLQEQVQQLTDTINELKENIAPISEEEAVNLSRENPNEEAPIRNNLTAEESQELDYLENMSKKFPLRGENLEKMESLRAKELNNPETEISPTRDLNDIRDYDEVGNRDVNAYQYEHPEVKPYFQEEARRMLADLDSSIKAEKYAIPTNEKGKGSSKWDWVGVKRQTSPEIAELLDGDRGYSYSYDDIRKGLNAIIEDHGNENIAVAKRIEFYLDERLRNGYTTMEGYEIEPNEAYNNMLREQEWTDYYETTPEITPPQEDLSDLELNLEPFMDYIDQSSENKQKRDQLRDEVNTKKAMYIPKENNVKRGLNLLKTMFVNEYAAVDDFAKQSGNMSIKHKADTYNNYQALAQSNISNAQTDNEGNAIGRSLNSIWTEAQNKGLREALDDYLIHYSNLDRSYQGKGGDYTIDQSKKLIKEYEAKYPELKPLAKAVWQYSRNARHNLRDAGVISPEVSNMLGRMYPHYVPFVSENVDKYYVDSKEIKPKSTIKRARGGANLGMLLPVEEALSTYTYSQFKSTLGNDLMREIVKTTNNPIELGADTRTNYVNADNLYRDENGYYLTAYDNGDQISTKISEDMYNALSNQMKNSVKGMEQKLSFITKPLQKLSRIRRDILTKWSPTFPVTNALKDIQDAGFNSKYTKEFIKHYPNALYELATNKGQAAQFKALYGSALNMGQYDVDSGLYNAKKGAKNLNFLKGIENANELIELAPRYAEFKASLDNGASLQEAMYNAREVTTNFSRGGVITKALNRNGFTFLNASVQGFDKFIRNFSGENGAKGIVNSMMKAAILGIAPAVFNELAFGWGDDKDEDYEALPDYIKDNYYLIKTSDGNFIRIPKGRMLSVFGSAARRTLEMSQGEDDAFKGYLSNVNNQIGVNNPEENNIFAPFLQAFGTKNGTAWYGGDIVPSRLQNVPAGEQTDSSIDWLSTFVGEKTGISPYKINYLLDQYSGGLGDLVLPMMTQEATSKAENPLEYFASGWADKFSVDSTTDNKYVSDFYSKKDEMTVKANSKNATDEDALKQKYLNNISFEMSELYKERREIQASDLPKAEKYEKAQAIKKEINALAKEGLDNFENVEINGDYANVNGQEYQKTEDGWKKMKSTTSDEVNSLGLSSKEKDTYVKTQQSISNIKSEYKGEDDSIGKKQEIISTIKNSKLDDNTKMSLYQDTYREKFANYVTDLGINVNSYLDFKSQDFSANKDSNGKSISGSKKTKVFNYVNSMNIPYEQKLILIKSEYNSYNDHNYEILDYINNSGMSYDEKMSLYKDLGFKVNGNQVSW